MRVANVSRRRRGRSATPSHPRGTRGAARRGAGRCSSARAPGCSGGVPCGTACSWAPSSATSSRPRAVRAAVAGNSAVRSGVVVKMMLTTSSWVELVAGEQLLHQPRRLGVDLGLRVLGAGDRAAQRLESHRVKQVSPVRSRPPAARSPVASPPPPRRAAHLPCRQRSPLAGLEPAVVQRPDARAHEPDAPDDRPPRTCGAPGGCGPRGCRSRPRPSSPRRCTTFTARGRGDAVVELDALAQRVGPSAGAGSPSTSARYVFTTPKLGWVSSCVSSPSLVSSSRPSVS